jgi:uncharacterized membrane protein YgcG
MKRSFIFLALLAAPLLVLASSPALAASGGVHDDAHFFSADAITQANQIIQQINQKHHKDLLIQTFPDIPQDLQAKFQQLGKQRFFEGWTNQQAKAQGVDGIYILITRDPGHLEVWVGNITQQRLFPLSDRDQLKRLLASSFGQKDYDGGLLQGVQFVQKEMDANGSATNSGATNSGAIPPIGSTPPSNFPSTNFPRSGAPSSRGDTSWGFGGLACVVVAVVLGIVFLRGILGRGRGGYSGGGGGYYPPGGGYAPGGYPPQGGYGYGGGGSGFGRGFLGGLLGGAVGGYAADKWMHGQQQGGGGIVPPTGGGADFGSGVDTGGSSSGADFGGGGGDTGGGADFGGGGGGTDFGGGGGDSGGSSGSDF